MPTDPQPNRERFAHLFADEADLDKALEQADLSSEPEAGLERRTVAVFRCAQIADERRQFLSPALVRRFMRAGALAFIVLILLIRATLGPQLSEQLSSWSLSPLYDTWTVVVQAVFSNPDYTDQLATLDHGHERELAAFHKLTTILTEAVLWSLLVLLGILFCLDIWRQFRRRQSAPREHQAPTAEERPAIR